MSIRSGSDVTLGVLHTVCQHFAITGDELEADERENGPPSRDLEKYAHVTNAARRCVQ
jgi:hypothetical protein